MSSEFRPSRAYMRWQSGIPGGQLGSWTILRPSCTHTSMHIHLHVPIYMWKHIHVHTTHRYMKKSLLYFRVLSCCNFNVKCPTKAHVLRAWCLPWQYWVTVETLGGVWACGCVVEGIEDPRLLLTCHHHVSSLVYHTLPTVMYSLTVGQKQQAQTQQSWNSQSIL